MADSACRAAAANSPPTVPQGRVDENEVREAEDALVIAIGRETIGIYSSGSVRDLRTQTIGAPRRTGLPGEHFLTATNGCDTHQRDRRAVRASSAAGSHRTVGCPPHPIGSDRIPV